MKNLNLTVLCGVALMLLFSCQKDPVSGKNEEMSRQELQEKKTAEAMRRFSEILSKAVNEEVALREFIKIEALKEFDNDYDVFYPLIKNQTVNSGRSFRDILSEYANSLDELADIEVLLPFLNIYVPELPSGFNAASWDHISEIPFVAPTVIKNDKITLYADGAVKDSLETQYIPGFPVLVVKNNERLRKRNTINLKSGSSFSTEMDNYEFIDDAYNGKLKTKAVALGDKYESQLIPEVFRAYQMMGVTTNNWQRDNIYYGLTLDPNTKGALNKRVIERIEKIKFTKEALYVMSDQSGDPAVRDAIGRTGLLWDAVQNLLWTDGRFEIQIDVLVGNANGLGSSLEKHINVAPQDLYVVEYEELFFLPSLRRYKVTDVRPKEYQANIDLIPWDLENNSYAWKFIISERDNQEVTTRTETHTSQFATNFGIDLGLGNDIVKLGLKFGLSNQRTVQNTFTLAVTQQSDPLGTLETFFDRPVIVGESDWIGGKMYNLHAIKNPYVEIKLLPVYAY